MKKTVTILMAVFISCTLFAGCNSSDTEEPQTDLTVYSFSGENEQFELSNGVIVLDGTKETFYGGDLSEKQEHLSDITAFTITFYIASGDEKDILFSNSVKDTTGQTLTVSGNTGKISGDIIIGQQIDQLRNNLYLELKTTDLNGEKSVYQIQLTLTEVTGNS